MDHVLDHCQLGLRGCLAHERTAVNVDAGGCERPTPALVTLLDIAKDLGANDMR